MILTHKSSNTTNDVKLILDVKNVIKNINNNNINNNNINNNNNSNNNNNYNFFSFLLTKQ